ncbi:MAG: TetR/AcrR family transcriptional regulator [Sarcina sp.]
MDNIFEKKNEIIHAGVYLFSNKGFAATSVQDIASYCNISKATIYKLFKSKEEILIEILKYLNRQILMLVENIDLNDKMSPLDKFEEKLYVLFEHLSNKKDFTVMIYQDQSLIKGEEFKKVSIESRFFILNWFKDIVLDTYGNDIKENIWDIVFTLDGIIKEFSRIFIIKEFLSKDHREISKYLVDVCSLLVEYSKNNKPLIPFDALNELNVEKDKLLSTELLLEEIRLLIEKIKSTTKNSKTIVNKEEIFEALDTLIKEKSNENSRKFIIEGILLYLSKYTELSNDINFLRLLYNKLQ